MSAYKYFLKLSISPKDSFYFRLCNMYEVFFHDEGILFYFSAKKKLFYVFNHKHKCIDQLKSRIHYSNNK